MFKLLSLFNIHNHTMLVNKRCRHTGIYLIQVTRSVGHDGSRQKTRSILTALCIKVLFFFTFLAGIIDDQYVVETIVERQSYVTMPL
jgi:hypothetical protein